MLCSYYDAVLHSASPPPAAAVPPHAKGAARRTGDACTANDQLNVQQSVDTRAALADCKHLLFSGQCVVFADHLSDRPPVAIGTRNFRFGFRIMYFALCTPLGSAFPPENKILYTQKKKKAKRKKEKKKKAADVSRRAHSECLFSVLFLFLGVAARGVHEGGYVKGRVISYR